MPYTTVSKQRVLNITYIRNVDGKQLKLSYKNKINYLKAAVFLFKF